MLLNSSRVRLRLGPCGLGASLIAAALLGACNDQLDPQPTRPEPPGAIAQSSETAVANASNPIVSLVVSPSADTLALGEKQTFTATIKRRDGTTTQVTPSWKATGGTISMNGVYTAGESAGKFLVIATRNSRADTARVTVTAAIRRVVLQPTSVALAAGDSRQFSATDSLVRRWHQSVRRNLCRHRRDRELERTVPRGQHGRHVPGHRQRRRQGRYVHGHDHYVLDSGPAPSPRVTSAARPARSRWQRPTTGLPRRPRRRTGPCSAR